MPGSLLGYTQDAKVWVRQNLRFELDVLAEVIVCAGIHCTPAILERWLRDESTNLPTEADQRLIVVYLSLRRLPDWIPAGAWLRTRTDKLVGRTRKELQSTLKQLVDNTLIEAAGVK